MKNVLKRGLPALLAMAVALSLTGCGGKASEPTVEELAARITEADLSGYYDVSMSMYGLVSDEDGEGRITLEADVESDGTVTHIKDMTMGFGMEGMAMEVSAEAWTDRSSKTAYMDMRVLGQDTGWVASSLDDADMAMLDVDATAGSLAGMAPADLSGVSMLDRAPGEDYILEWEMDPSTMDGLMDAMAEAGSAGVGDRIQSMHAAAAFDGSSHELKSLSVSGTGDGAELAIVMTFHAIGGGTALSVPQDVVDAAADAGDGAYAGSDGDEGYAYDEDGWLETCEDGYLTDGDGHDDMIDGLAKAAVPRLSDGETATVIHYSDYAELTIRHDGDDDWSGEIGVRHVTDSSYGGAQGYFDSEKGFLDSWYDGVEGALVESTDTMFLYVADDSELDLCEMDGDVLVSISIYTYEGAGRDVLDSCVAHLKSLAGVE